MVERTTNTQLGEQIAAIQERLEHMATKEQVARLARTQDLSDVREEMSALRQDVRNIERQLPNYERAATGQTRDDGRREGEKASQADERSDRSFFASIVALAISAAVAVSEFLKGN